MEALSYLNIARNYQNEFWKMNVTTKLIYVVVILQEKKASPFNIKRSVNTTHVHTLQERYRPTEDENIDFSA